MFVYIGIRALAESLQLVWREPKRWRTAIREVIYAIVFLGWFGIAAPVCVIALWMR
jgi:hypothetical protein